MIKLNAQIYKDRLNSLPQNINQSPICFLLPKNKQIPMISLNSSMFLYLFGYEFPETLLIIYNREVIVLTSESKLNLLKELNKQLEQGEQIRLYNKDNLQRNLLEIGKLLGQKVFIVEQLEESDFTRQCINYFINTNQSTDKEDNELMVASHLYKSLDKQGASVYFFMSSILNVLIESINELIINNMFRVYDFTDALFNLIDCVNLTSGYLNMNNEYILYEGDFIDFYKENDARKYLLNSDEGNETTFDIYKYSINLRVAQYCGRISRTFSVNCKNRQSSINTEVKGAYLKNEETADITIEELIKELYLIFDRICSLIQNREVIPEDILNSPLLMNSNVIINTIGLLPIYKTYSLEEYNEILRAFLNDDKNIALNIILTKMNIEIADIVLINKTTFKEIEMSYAKNYTKYKPKYNSIYLFNGILNKGRLEKDLYFEREEEKRIELRETQKELLNNLIEKRLSELNNPLKEIKKRKIENIELKRKEENLLKRSQSLIIDKIDLNNIKINLPFMQYMLSIPYSKIRNISILTDSIIRINIVNNPAYKLKSISYRTNTLEKDFKELNDLKNINYNIKVKEEDLGKCIYKIEIKMDLDFKMAKKFSIGILEFYETCLTFSPLNILNNKLVLFYKDIAALYYNIKQNEQDRYFIHFNLLKPILFNNKLTNNIQFSKELIEKISDTSKVISKKEEQDIEYEEMRLRNLFINQIKSILNILNKTEFQMGKIEQLGTSFPAVLKEQVDFHFTKNSIVCLQQPYYFIDLRNIEVICFERIISDNFDLSFISYEKENEELFSFKNIFNINIKHLNELKHIFNTRGLIFIESKMNLNWVEVLKSIKNDLLQFYEAGAWKDLMFDDEDEDVSDSNTALSSLTSSDSTLESSADTEELETRGYGKEDVDSDSYSDSYSGSSGSESLSGSYESDSGSE